MLSNIIGPDTESKIALSIVTRYPLKERGLDFSCENADEALLRRLKIRRKTLPVLNILFKKFV
jgi:hypothetical protein